MTARGVYRAKSQLFVLESRFLSTGHSTSTPRATTFLFRPPRKKNRFRAMGHFQGSPRYLAISGHSHLRSIKYP